MSKLSGKPKFAGSWLPTQVAYGIDTSDANPENWKPFGEAYDAERADAELLKHSKPSKIDQRPQPLRAES